jgi:nucleoside diphosphate kinase
MSSPLLVNTPPTYAAIDSSSTPNSSVNTYTVLGAISGLVITGWLATTALATTSLWAPAAVAPAQAITATVAPAYGTPATTNARIPTAHAAANPYTAAVAPTAATTNQQVNNAIPNTGLMALFAVAAAGLGVFLRSASRTGLQPEPLMEVSVSRSVPETWSMASVASAAVGQKVYVINGFYMSMREKYTQDGAKIQYMLAEWDADKLSWADFRGKVLGATDPATAPEGSIRRTILDKYSDLGLDSEPNVGDNGVHASASPFEGLFERMNWVGADIESDGFGKALLEAGIPKETIVEWSKDPKVELDGESTGFFDCMEDLNVKDAIEKAQKIAGVSGPINTNTNMAFVFIKPHAMKPAAIDLAKEMLTGAGIELGDSDVLDNKTIEEKKLIDNHYYAIANKASLTKPKDLSPPADKQEEFASLFGTSWSDVLAENKVFNALDACAELGVDGNELDGIWATAKKGGKLVKFGGGFYVGELDA